MWVKICGMANLEDAAHAIQAGADALGFVFAPSPRQVNIERVRRMIPHLPQRAEAYGVFVDADADVIVRTVLECGLSGVQLHASRDTRLAENVRRQLLLHHAEMTRIVTVIRFNDTLKEQLETSALHADAVLVDSRSATRAGGTGESWDWAAGAPAIREAARKMRVIAAGGLNAVNVGQAIETLKPWGVDVVTGVESSPGCKDHGRVEAFIRNAKGRVVPSMSDSGGLRGVIRRLDAGIGWDEGTSMATIAAAVREEIKAKAGRFGAYGGRYVPETLVAALEELELAYEAATQDPAFHTELNALLADFAGRPTPLFFASRLTKILGGAKIYLKREDLLHTGAHKINNAVGQGLLARRMGKQRIIAETGAGQHGVATATVCALFGMECVIYMGEEDMRRQELNVYRMRLLGADVRSVSSGSRTLKDAINEAMRDWVTNVRTTHYMLGSVLGAHPYPTMVRDFHRVIGEEARRQILQKEGRLPDAIIACVGGGSNAIGAFYEFLNDTGVRLIGVEAGGRGNGLGDHAARFSKEGGGVPGVLQGTYSYVLQDEGGQVSLTHSVSAGLDYASVGPEHAALHDAGRAEYTSASDKETLDAVVMLSRTEGVVPALESAHAVAECIKMAPAMSRNAILIVNLSGRGDKDMGILARELDLKGAQG